MAVVPVVIVSAGGVMAMLVRVVGVVYPPPELYPPHPSSTRVRRTAMPIADSVAERIALRDFMIAS